MLRLIKMAVSRDTLAVLRCLLDSAKKGQLRGVAVCYWTTTGRREVVLTGAFRAQPEHAFGAAVLIKVKACNQLQLFA